MPKELTYPKTAANKINRHNDRAHYDTTTIHRIVNSAQVLHVSFVAPTNPKDPASPPLPVILPMIGQMGSFAYPSSDESDPLDCYLHGYISSRIINLSRNPAGISLCVAATKLDGLVLSLTPFSHSYNYRSATLHGTAVPVTDPAEKLYAMKLITNSVVPERWENTRVPPEGAEMAATAVLRMTVNSAAAKVRAGPPGDDAKDLRREVAGEIWTGVVPVWETLGTPIEAGGGAGGGPPEHVVRYIEERNRREREYAEGAVRKER